MKSSPSAVVWYDKNLIRTLEGSNSNFTRINHLAAYHEVFKLCQLSIYIDMFIITYEALLFLSQW